MSTLASKLLVIGNCVLLACATSCKQSDSKVQSIDNFASADGTIQQNICRGSHVEFFAVPQVEIPDSYQQTPEQEEATIRAVLTVLSAVPESVRILYFAAPASIRITPDVAAECRRQLSTVDERFASEGVKLEACWGKEESGKMRIYISPNPRVIAQHLVRMFGRLLSDIYGGGLSDAQLRGAPADFREGVLNFRTQMRAISETFVDEIAERQRRGDSSLSLKQYKDLISTSSGRRVFDSYVFAEAFDSYYCNASGEGGTRQRFARLTPRTYEAFAKYARTLENVTDRFSAKTLNKLTARSHEQMVKQLTGPAKGGFGLRDGWSPFTAMWVKLGMENEQTLRDQGIDPSLYNVKDQKARDINNPSDGELTSVQATAASSQKVNISGASAPVSQESVSLAKRADLMAKATVTGLKVAGKLGVPLAGPIGNFGEKIVGATSTETTTKIFDEYSKEGSAENQSAMGANAQSPTQKYHTGQVVESGVKVVEATAKAVTATAGGQTDLSAAKNIDQGLNVFLDPVGSIEGSAKGLAEEFIPGAEGAIQAGEHAEEVVGVAEEFFQPENAAAEPEPVTEPSGE